MKWFQSAGGGKWIETDGPFSIFGEGGSIGCLGTLVIIIIFGLMLFRPSDLLEFLLNLFINWPIAFLSSPTVDHFLTSIFG